MQLDCARHTSSASIWRNATLRLSKEKLTSFSQLRHNWRMNEEAAAGRVSKKRNEKWKEMECEETPTAPPSPPSYREPPSLDFEGISFCCMPAPPSTPLVAIRGKSQPKVHRPNFLLGRLKVASWYASVLFSKKALMIMCISAFMTP